MKGGVLLDAKERTLAQRTLENLDAGNGAAWYRRGKVLQTRVLALRDSQIDGWIASTSSSYAGNRLTETDASARRSWRSGMPAAWS